MKEMKIFKIQRNSDKLFSIGGESGKFSKKGKMWSQRSHVISHLNFARYGSDLNCMMLIEYDVNEDDGSMVVIKKTPLGQVKCEANDRKQKLADKKKASLLNKKIAAAERDLDAAQWRLDALLHG